MRSVQNFITIAARRGQVMWPIHMRSVGRKPQGRNTPRLAAQNAVEWAFLRSGVRSRSGKRAMPLNRGTGSKTGRPATTGASLSELVAGIALKPSVNWVIPQGPGWQQVNAAPRGSGPTAIGVMLAITLGQTVEQ